MCTAWKLLAGFGAIVVLLLVGVLVAVSTIDVASLVGPIKERVKAATGRELTVRGDTRFSLSLTPRLVLSDVALANAPWGEAKALLAARRLELEVALLPLLSRRFELTEVIIVDPVIALERDASGRGNWETVPVKTGVPDAAGKSGPGTAFGVGNVSVTNGTLTYRDGAGGKVTNVAIERMFVRARDAKAPIATQFRGTIDGVPVAVEGTLGPLEQLLAQRWPYPVSLKGEVAGQSAAANSNLRTEQAKIALDDLKVTFGSDTVTGTLAIATGGARPKLLFDLTGTTAAFGALLSARAAPTPAASARPGAGTARLFSDQPFDFAPLRAVDAEGTLAIGKPAAPGGVEFADLRANLNLQDGRLNLRQWSVRVWGGTIAGTVSVDAHDPAVAKIIVTLDGRELDAGALLAAAGLQREVRGGKTAVTANLTLAGASPRAWAQSATGSVLVNVGKATLPQTRASLGPSLQELLDAVNPFRSSDPQTDLVCAVARLPIERGVARIDNSLGVETTKIGATASGTLDFGRETLDLAIQPRARKGIALDLVQFADLVRVSGPFASPQVKVDLAGSVKALASIGAAIGTGGLSAVGQSLIAWTEDQGPGPCAIAMGVRAGATASAAPSNPAVPLANEVGKAVNRLFGK